MEEFVQMMSVISAFSSIGSLISIALYVLQALGLYTIAQRRGIQYAWLAWLPVGNVWILGSIADDYRLKAKGEVKNRRKVMMILTAITVVFAIIVCGSMFGSLFELFHDVERLYGRYYGYEYKSRLDDTMAEFMISFVPVVLMSLVMAVVSIVSAVFTYICLYDLFASCEPQEKTLYLLLSIFVSGLSGIFIFICRNKDQGMFPAAPRGYYQPQYQQPQYQPPQYQQPQYQPPQYQPPQYQQPQYQPPQYQPPQYQPPQGCPEDER